jgi:hypothetical protein
LDGGAGFFPAANPPRRHQAGDLLPMACDYHLFALFYQVKQLAKSILRLKSANLPQGILLKLA